MNYKIYNFVLDHTFNQIPKDLIYLQPSLKLNISRVGKIVFS
jgi:hypothetical protein